MANRKVLINYHTSGSSAPTPADVFHGELVVAHETGKETIFTKNNADAMVPFISCAQTIAIIDSKIKAADVSYDVKAGAEEQHIVVTPSQEGSAVTFTLTSSDVQSGEEFKAYSADTKLRIDNVYSAETALTAVVSALTDVVLTGISGDSIIVAEILNPTTGANYVALTHRTGEEASGFKKLSTDAYGHVTASTDVVTADIQALGFKTSAETGEDLAELSASVVTNKTNIEALSAGTLADIEALSGDVISYVNNLSAGTIQLSADTEAAISKAINDLDSAISASTAGKYITAIAIENGLLNKIEEADLPTLEVESAGTGNVVSSIAVNDHKITYNTVSVATSEDIQELSAATIALSAGTIHDIETLSGDVISYVKVVSGNIETVINELSAATTGISDDLATLSGATEAISGFAATQIEQLSAGTIMVSGFAHGEIAELSGAVMANETDIDDLSAATLDLSAVTLTGVSLNNTPLTVTGHVVSVPVTTSGSGIANATESGSVADALAVKEYVQNTVSSAVEYKGATDDVPAGTPVKGDLWIASAPFEVDGQNVETGDFIIYDGEQWQVIEKNLDGAITGTLTQDTVTLGDSTNSVKSLTNGAQGTVLTIGSAGTPVWANDPELSVVSAGTGNVVTDIAVNDHEITFTKGLIAASSADVTSLSAAVVTLSADTAAISAGTLQLSADTHNKIVEVYGSATSYADALIAGLDSVGSASTTGHYLTSVTITDGKISAVGEVAVPAGVVITATTATPVDTASAVLTGVTASGTDNHELTFGMSNKVFSASSSDSAVTAVSATTSLSAQTSVSANMAYELSSAATITSGQVTDIVAGIENTKVHEAESADTAASADKVAEKLTATDGTNNVEYDGSAAKTLTFGTNTAAGNSMSMTTGGTVDVEVIDCGTY